MDTTQMNNRVSLSRARACQQRLQLLYCTKIYHMNHEHEDLFE